MAGPTPRPFTTSFICAAVAMALALAFLFMRYGAPGGARGAGEVVGRLLVVTIIPALIKIGRAHV